MSDTKVKTSDDIDILSIARNRLTTAMSATSDSRANQVEDLKFAAGSPDNNWQWPEYAQNSRLVGEVVARPMLTINKLPQHIKQVTNDQRQNRPTGKVISANGDASVDVAEVIEGIVRHIEKISTANLAYNTACESITTHGEGYWRILTNYTDEDSFDQDIFIEHIDNPFSVYLDPLMKKPWGEGAQWGFIAKDLTHDEYEHQFPDASIVSSLQEMGTGDQGPGDWVSEKTIRIAEYFCYENTREKLNLYPDNKTAFEGTPEDNVYRKHLGDPIKSRQSDRKKVKWYKINGYEVLEKQDWPGKYIPIIRTVGNEFKIEGRTYLSGIVRNAKDAQRMYNYHCSQEVEMLALAPKAPFIGAAGQFDGFEPDWKTANTQNHPYLQYNPIVDDASGNLLPAPQRVQPPMVQEGIISAKRGASEDIKDATGQYNASLGQQSNERSGKAILARQHEGDVSTYHYGDNLAQSIEYSTTQIVDLIPKIYDRPDRIARILGEDGSSKMVKLNSEQEHPVMGTPHPDDPKIIIEKIYNPSVGKYDVTAVSGPGFATKRQEALDSMAQLLQATPELWKIAGDLFVKNMDWPGAQELAKRFEKTIDPKLLENGDDSPALQQAKQQLQQLDQELQQAHMMLQNVQKSMEAQELDIKKTEAQVKIYDAQTKRIAATSTAAMQEQGMTPESVQEAIMGTVHAMITAGHLIGTIPGTEGMMQLNPQQSPQHPQEQPAPIDQTKLMQEGSKHILQANQHNHEQQMIALQAQQTPGGDNGTSN